MHRKNLSVECADEAYIEWENARKAVQEALDALNDKPHNLDLEALNAAGQAVRDRWTINAEHDTDLLDSGAIYPKDGQAACPKCNADSFRSVGNGKFECGNCEYYLEY